MPRMFGTSNLALDGLPVMPGGPKVGPAPPQKGLVPGGGGGTAGQDWMKSKRPGDVPQWMKDLPGYKDPLQMIADEKDAGTYQDGLNRTGGGSGGFDEKKGEYHPGYGPIGDTKIPDWSGIGPPPTDGGGEDVGGGGLLPTTPDMLDAPMQGLMGLAPEAGLGPVISKGMPSASNQNLGKRVYPMTGLRLSGKSY